MPRRSRSSARSGTPASGMLTLKRAVPVSKSTALGTAMPTASALPAARMAVTNCWSSSSSLSQSVGQLPTSVICDPSSTATATFVPPTSTPMSRSATRDSYPITHEQHVLMLQQVQELQCDGRVERGPHHRPRTASADELGGEREEELVDDAGGQQGAEDRRPALAEQRAHAVLGAQPRERPRGVRVVAGEDGAWLLGVG